MSAYCVISYVLSLRGDEGLLINLKKCLELQHTPEMYTIIPLLGRLKGSKGEYSYLFPSVNLTESGINVKGILSRAVKMMEFLRFVDGPLISDSEGFLWSSSTIDDMMHEILCELFSQDPSLFSVQIKSEGDIKMFFHCYRTFRRSSDTRATEMKVDILDIDVVNRWRTEAKKT